MLLKVLEWHAEMRVLCLESGILEKSYNALVAKAQLCLATDLKLLHDWMKSLREKEYEKLRYTKGLLPQEIWDRYAAFGEDDLREQQLLKAAQVSLRKAWRNAPKIKPPKQDRPRKGSPPESFRSAKTISDEHSHRHE